MNMKASKEKKPQTINVSSGAGEERFIVVPGLMPGWQTIEGCSEREQHKVL